jgi:hypothetical protein
MKESQAEARRKERLTATEAFLEGARNKKDQETLINKEKQDQLSEEKKKAESDLKNREIRQQQQKILLRDQKRAEINGMRQIKAVHASEAEKEKEIVEKDKNQAEIAAKSLEIRIKQEKEKLRDKRTAEINGMRQLKAANTVEATKVKELLENDKIQAEIQTKSLEIRAKQEKEKLHEQRTAEINGMRQIKVGNASVAEKEKEIIENEKKQSEKDAKSHQDRMKQEKEKLREQRAAEIEGMLQIKAGHVAEAEKEKAILEKDKQQAEIDTRSSEVRGATEKDVQRSQARAEIESIRQLKASKNFDAEKEREFLALDKQQAEVAAKERGDRLQREKEKLHEQRTAEIEGIRQIKAGNAVEAEKEKQHFERDKAEAEIESKSREDRMKQEKEKLREQRAAEIEGMRQIKAGHVAEAEKEKAILEKDKQQSVVDLKSRDERSKQEKEIFQNHRSAQIEGMRQKKLRKSFEDEQSLEYLELNKLDERSLMLSGNSPIADLLDANGLEEYTSFFVDKVIVIILSLLIKFYIFLN